MIVQILHLRVAEKKKNKIKNKNIHYVAPQVWVWREGRVKKIKKFIDHILLLFSFEKKYFERKNGVMSLLDTHY